MIQSLEIMADEERQSMNEAPSQYYKPLQEFTKYDEKILFCFLNRERGEKTHIHKYQSWNVITGKGIKKYSRPKKYYSKAKKKIDNLKNPEQSNLGRLLTTIGMDPYSIALIKRSKEISTKMYELEIKMNETIVAYAKQIAEERKIKPHKAVKEQEFRDEIYRRIFSSETQFEKYFNILNSVGSMMSYVSRETLENFQAHINKKTKIPWIFKSIFKYIIKLALKKSLQKI